MSLLFRRPRAARAWQVVFVAILTVVPLVAFAAPAQAGATIVWTNRGPGDGFDTVFGGGTATDQARALVDAAIDNWERVINSLNRPATPGDDTLEITVTMETDDPGQCGGSADGNFDGDGWSEGGDVTIKGQSNVWFIDPTPFDNSEFTGNIDNVFSGDAQGSSPANGLCDMFTVVVNEITHILGITSKAASRFQTAGFNTQLSTDGNVCGSSPPTDNTDPGDSWQFTGPSIVALLTSNNAGSGGSDKGVPVHTAEPCETWAGPPALFGSNDSGNALFEGGRRYLPSNLDALILKDTYNFDITMPETFGTFYSTLNSTTGNLLVRGGDDNDTSADVITITQSAGQIAVSVDVGNDVPGTGPTDPFVSTYSAGQIQSITVNAGDGNDIVTIDNTVGVDDVTVNGDNGDDTLIGGDITINGGAGNDHITGSVANDTLNGDAGDDTIHGFEGDDTITGGSENDDIYAADGNDVLSGNAGNDLLYAGTGNNTVTDGTGNDTVDLTENSAPLNYGTGGGNDTVLGSSFDDALGGNTGSDRLEGRGGNDLLAGGGAVDALLGGDGSDTVRWSPGNGSDTVEGGAGESDVIEVIASGADDLLIVASTPFATGSRLEILSGIDTVDIGSVEDVDINSAGGADTVALGHLFGTEVRRVFVDVGAGVGDVVSVHTSPTADLLDVSWFAPDLRVGGLPNGLVIRGLEADDSLDVNGAAADDALTVYGTDGDDTIQVVPGTSGGGSVTGAVPTVVNASNVESLVADGDGGNNVLQLTTPAGTDNISLTPGADTKSGDIAVSGLTPVSFRDVPELVALLDTGGNTDNLTYNGTALADTFSVAPSTSIINLDFQVPVDPVGINALFLKGFQGDDAFNLPATLPFATTTTNGGDSVDGDRVALDGAGGAVTLNTANSTVTGYGGSVELNTIESLSTNQTGVGGTDLTVLGKAGPDTINYVPSGPDSGALSIAGFAPGLSFSGAGGTFTVDPLDGTDVVDVFGTLANDTINILAQPVSTIQMNATKTVAVPQATTERLQVESDQGSDSYDVTVYDTVTGFLTLFGDTPSAKRFSDKLTVRNGVPAKVMYSDVKAHTFEEGSAYAKYKNGAVTQIDYFGVETIKFVR